MSAVRTTKARVNETRAGSSEDQRGTPQRGEDERQSHQHQTRRDQRVARRAVCALRAWLTRGAMAERTGDEHVVIPVTTNVRRRPPDRRDAGEVQGASHLVVAGPREARPRPPSAIRSASTPTWPDNQFHRRGPRGHPGGPGNQPAARAGDGEPDHRSFRVTIATKVPTRRRSRSTWSSGETHPGRDSSDTSPRATIWPSCNMAWSCPPWPTPR